MSPPAELPQSVSPEMRAALAALPQEPPGASIEQRRAFATEAQEKMRDVQRAKYGDVAITQETRGGVLCRVFKPKKPAKSAEERLLINFHGGGFILDSGSLSENIPIAALTGYTIVSGLYRMAPEHAFPAAVDDALAVYRDALKTYHPSRIVVFGTSAGGILTAQLLARLRKENLPMPAAAGMFTMLADWATPGDSEAGFLPPGVTAAMMMKEYSGEASLTDPLLSPIYDDLSAYPKSLLIAGTRDLLLSHTVWFHTALVKAGADARLVVFEALPHAHWAYTDAPESEDAFKIMARFFADALA